MPPAVPPRFAISIAHSYRSSGSAITGKSVPVYYQLVSSSANDILTTSIQFSANTFSTRCSSLPRKSKRTIPRWISKDYTKYGSGCQLIKITPLIPELVLLRYPQYTIRFLRLFSSTDLLLPSFFLRGQILFERQGIQFLEMAAHFLGDELN
jgi:hypothetical protein